MMNRKMLEELSRKRYKTSRHRSMIVDDRLVVLLASIVLATISTTVSVREVYAKGKRPKPTACTTLISKCGCTILTSGFYQVQNNVNFSGTLNAEDSSCIAVSASHVTLFLQGYNVADSLEAMGIGIHLNFSATFSVVAGGGSTVSGWQMGIEDDADNVTITNVETDYNNDVGIEVQSAENVTVSQFGSDNNGNYGVLLNATRNADITGGVIEPASKGAGISNNGKAGIMVTPSKKSGGGPLITGNCVSWNAGAGIEFAADVGGAKVTDNQATDNTGDDFSDMNNNCGTNLWFGNLYGNGTPATCLGIQNPSLNLCPPPPSM